MQRSSFRGPSALFLAGLLVTLVVSPGCPPVGDIPTPIGPPEFEPSELRERLDENLRQVYFGRQLDVREHAAWQILHGALAFGQDFRVATPEGPRSAVKYLQAGGAMRGWDPQPGDLLGSPERRGVRMELDPGTKAGQGHRDQWLAILAQCDLPLEAEILLEGQRFTIADFVRQAEWDVPRNLEREFSWTLIVMAAYRPADHQWRTRDGRSWNLTDLVQYEVGHDLPLSACGGTHRLIGLATAVRHRREAGLPLDGPWAEAERILRASIDQAREVQNADGSFSTTFLHRPGWTSDLADVLRTTGHVLEFLAIAAPDATLQEPWVRRSATRLCEVLETTRQVDLECGALYHAVHGMVLYRQRCFGPTDLTTPGIGSRTD